jgi:tetratricopeptide (TPR) repeat protein
MGFEKATKIFTKLKAYDWRSETKYFLGQTLLYANQLDAAMGVAAEAKEDALKAGSRNDEAAAEFLMACVASLRNDLDRIPVHLERAERLAEEGPSFSLLGYVYRIWSDYWMGKRDLKKALRARDLSNDFFSLAPHLPALAIGRVARIIMKAYPPFDFTEDDFEAFKLAVEEYRQYGDLSMVVTQWAEMTMALMARPRSPASRCMVAGSVETCAALSREFAALKGIDLSAKAAFEATCLDARLASHVDEWPLVVRMLAQVLMDWDDSEPTMRSLRSQYHTLKARIEAHGYASPLSEALVGTLSSHLYRKRVLPGAELIRYDKTVGNAQFTKKAVKVMLLSRGLWQVEYLL